jgi:RNA recognition motif. (a.k.a. RRM, RBD, or RNP domain)
VILKKMVTADEITEGEEELKEEILEEASKYGNLSVADIDLRVEGNEGVVVLNYKTHEEAQRAFAAMNNRFFGGSTIQAVLE